MKKLLLVPALVLVAGVAASQQSLSNPSSPGGGSGGTMFCPICQAATRYCYANYGVDCQIPTGMTSADHCTDQEAHDSCLGWAEKFPGRGLSSNVT